MTEQDFNKLLHSQEQLTAFMQDWWNKTDEVTKQLLNQMMMEQKNLNMHLNNRLQVCILIMAQMKLFDFFQESERRKREEL